MVARNAEPAPLRRFPKEIQNAVSNIGINRNGNPLTPLMCLCISKPLFMTSKDNEFVLNSLVILFLNLSVDV